VIAAVVTAPACSDDDGSDSEGTGAPIDTAPAVVEDPGVIVGQQSVDGRLADAVVVVDPTSGMTDVVDVPDLTLSGGVPAGPGRVIYSTNQDLVLVDTTGGTVTDLDLPAAQYSPAVATATGGVGDDWAALVDAAGSAPRPSRREPTARWWSATPSSSVATVRPGPSSTGRLRQ
jgi:hypothetical protein